MSIMKLLITPVVLILILLSLTSAAFAETTVTPDGQVQTTDVSSGIPMVSSQQVAAKVNRISDNVYGLAQAVAPKLSIIVIVILLILAIITRKAWLAILAVFVGLIFIIWGVQIMGWIMHFKNV